MITNNECLTVDNTHRSIQLPLEMKWNPKEDITTFELALCIPYLLREVYVMEYEVDLTQPHFRHFEIINHNYIDKNTVLVSK